MASPILPDDLWKRLEPLIPKPKENRHVQFAGRKPADPRRVLTEILFVLRTGIPWRWLPATSDFPCGQTCRRRLRQWHQAGIWQGIFETLLAELQTTHKIDWYRALVDSASVRAPCGGAKTGPNPTDRRKLGSKHHMLTDANGIPLACILKGIKPLLAKRRTAHGSGLGKTRWFIERTLAWLHQFRKLKTREEKHLSTHEALLLIACSVICHRFLSC